jgi:hypothetical protein
VSFVPAAPSVGGAAAYTYRICVPPQGRCTFANGTAFAPPEHACSDHAGCRAGPLPDDALCTVACAVEKFQGLSHVNVGLPGAACVPAGTEVSGTCSSGTFTLGDASCDAAPGVKVVKCDGTTLDVPGTCIDMTLSIAGETNGLGVGRAFIVDKAGNECVGTCLAGPSCEPCGPPPPPPPGADPCLTRTIGFWGTHPWITNDYTPVTPCGYAVGCNGPNTTSVQPNACTARACASVMEALGSVPSESKQHGAYISFLRQLTAARLNLAATARAWPNAACRDYRVVASGAFAGKPVADVLAACDASAACSASAAKTLVTACAEALDEFNNSPDVLVDAETPAPFRRPGVDDAGAVRGADASAFVAAHSGGWIMGRNTGSGKNCV